MGCGVSKEWGDKHVQCTVDYVMRNAEPGDIILFAGVGGASDFIRFTSPSENWSHVGPILRVNGGLVITEAYKTVIGRDIIRKDFHSGIQTVPLRERLLSYEGGRVAWRPIRHRGLKEITRVQQEEFVQRILRYPEMPTYASGIGELIEYGTRWDDDEDIGSDGKEFYVCTSWTASVWQEFGIYQKFYTDSQTGERKKRNPGRLLLADIGMAETYVPFVQGWEAQEIHFIQTPQSEG